MKRFIISFSGIPLCSLCVGFYVEGAQVVQEVFIFQVRFNKGNVFEVYCFVLLCIFIIV